MNETPGTIAQAAYDIWLSNAPASEVMIWVDNAGRGDGGATRIGAATVGGKAFTIADRNVVADDGESTVVLCVDQFALKRKRRLRSQGHVHAWPTANAGARPALRP
jgi:hypothetical protein